MQGDMEYKCVYVRVGPSSPDWMSEYAEQCTREINEYVKRGWKIIHISRDCFHLVRGYRMELEEAA